MKKKHARRAKRVPVSTADIYRLLLDMADVQRKSLDRLAAIEAGLSVLQSWLHALQPQFPPTRHPWDGPFTFSTTGRGPSRY